MTGRGWGGQGVPGVDDGGEGGGGGMTEGDGGGRESAGHEEEEGEKGKDTGRKADRSA